MSILFVVSFGVMACLFLAVGLRVVTSKKPLIFSARFFFAFMVFAFIPSIANSVRLIGMTGSGGVSLLFWVNPVMFAFLLLFFWIHMKGYILIGVNDESFRQALHTSLNRQGFPFEERLSVVVLPEQGAEIQVALQSWVGAGQIKLKKSKDHTLLKAVVDGINQYYMEEPAPSNYITAVLYIIMGIILLLVAGVLFGTF